MAEPGDAMRIGVIGCAGRMGRTNLQEVLATPAAELAGGVERAGHPAVGQDLGLLRASSRSGGPSATMSRR